MKSKIFPALFIIVASYLLGSYLIKEINFLYFDLMWRLVIIFFVLVFTKYKLHLSKKQYLVLLILFICEGLCYFFFSPGTKIARILISTTFAPLAEELFFRGWIISQVKGSKRQKIIISSLCFALYHLKNAFVLTVPALIYQVSYAGFIVGPIFAWICLRYDSIFPTIMLHSVNNFIGDVVTPKFIPFIGKKNKDFQ